MMSETTFLLIVWMFIFFQTVLRMAKLNGKTISDETWKRAEVTEVRYLSWWLSFFRFHDTVNIVRWYIAYKFAIIFIFFSKTVLWLIRHRRRMTHTRRTIPICYCKAGYAQNVLRCKLRTNMKLKETYIQCK